MTILFLLVIILGCGGATPTATPIATLLSTLTPTPTAAFAPTVTSEPIPTLIPMFNSVPTLTSTPTQELTPTATPTPAANPTTILLPQRPLIRLRNDGQVYRGVAGNSCWPAGPLHALDKLCGVEGPFPWEVVDTATGENCPPGASWCGPAVTVLLGDSIIVEIDADDRPKGLQVAIYDNDSKAASDHPAQVIKLETGFTVPFPVDVPAGTYYIRISGQRDDGDIAYKFKMLVTS